MTANLPSSTALADLRWFIQRVAGVQELVSALENTTSLENYAAELQSLVDKLKLDCSALAEGKSKLSNDIAVAKVEVVKVAEDAAAAAKEVVEAAKATAAAYREEARGVLADEIRDLSNDKARRVAEIEVAKATLDGLAAKVAAAQADYESIQAAIAAVKAKF